MLPFTLKEVDLDWDTWRPDTKQTYLVEYDWSKKTKKSEKPIYIIGHFAEVHYGYSFRWFWSASNLQLSMDKNYDKDRKCFQRIWEFHIIKEFITDKDIEL